MLTAAPTSSAWVFHRSAFTRGRLVCLMRQTLVGFLGLALLHGPMRADTAVDSRGLVPTAPHCAALVSNNTTHGAPHACPVGEQNAPACSGNALTALAAHAGVGRREVAKSPMAVLFGACVSEDVSTAAACREVASIPQQVWDNRKRTPRKHGIRHDGANMGGSGGDQSSGSHVAVVYGSKVLAHGLCALPWCWNYCRAPLCKYGP